MYHIKVPDGINLIITIYQRLGFWNVEDENACSKRVKIFHFLFYASFSLSLGVRAYNSNDNGESVFFAAGAIGSIVQLARLFYLIWSREEILSLIVKAESFIIEDYEKSGQIDKKLKAFRKLMKYFALMITIVLVSLFVFDTVLEEKTLPLNIAFPVDWKNSEIGYWLAFTYLAIEWIYCFLLFFFNILILYIMLCFTIKCDLLGSQLRQMGMVKITRTKTPVPKLCQLRHMGMVKMTRRKTPVPKLSEAEKENLFLQDIIASIGSHQDIREAVNEFQLCFSNLFFIQIVTSSMGICGCVYTLAFIYHDNLFQTLMFVFYLLYNIFDIFVITYLGSEMKFSSDKYSYCLFESNWIEQSQKCKKCIIILAEILQQPHELVIVIYQLNLETFTTIVNLAYKMFNILRNLK